MRSSVNVSSIVLIITTPQPAEEALFPLLFGGRCGAAVTGQLNGVRLRQFPGVSSPIRKLCGCWRKIAITLIDNFTHPNKSPAQGGAWWVSGRLSSFR